MPLIELEIKETGQRIESLEELCKICGGGCCSLKGQVNTYDFSNPPREEINKRNYRRLVNGFIKDREFRKQLVISLILKYPNIGKFIRQTKTKKQGIELIIEFSKTVPFNNRCFYYSNGCLIHKYKPSVCKEYTCREYDNLKDLIENGNQ